MLTKYNRRTVSATSGAVVGGALVRFYNQNTGAPVTAYNDAAGTSPIGTTVTSGAGGEVEVFIPPGLYRITVSVGSDIVDEITHEPITGNAAIIEAKAPAIGIMGLDSPVSDSVIVTGSSGLSEYVTIEDLSAEIEPFINIPASGVNYPDPAHNWYGPTGTVIDSTPSQISGDPFIVFDGAQWVMYFFRSVSGSPYVKTFFRTASILGGEWSAATELTSLAGYHKFVLLVDDEGTPQKIGGNYHGYASSFNGTAGTKEVYHFTCATLTGTWVTASKVIAKGAGGEKDELFTDTPFAIFKDGTIYLWYMGAPASDLGAYDLATRILLATATNPDGVFTKDADDVILPSGIPGEWDYGWLGGVQIRKRPDGSYIMIYNAGNSRATVPGDEPAASAIGYAYSATLAGPWAKDPSNPYLSITGSADQALEKINVWRGHIVYEPKIKKWLMYYNTGLAGVETITYAISDTYEYVRTIDEPLSDGSFNVQQLTTSLTPITDSRVNVTPGLYLYTINLNHISNGASSAPTPLNVDVKVRLNGTALTVQPQSREFIGSYAYENRNIVVSKLVMVNDNSYIDATVQVTEGTPVATSYARRLRVQVSKL